MNEEDNTFPLLEPEDMVRLQEPCFDDAKRKFKFIPGEPFTREEKKVETPKEEEKKEAAPAEEKKEE